MLGLGISYSCVRHVSNGNTLERSAVYNLSCHQAPAPGLAWSEPSAAVMGVGRAGAFSGSRELAGLGGLAGAGTPTGGSASGGFGI
jgi:hypothetical protein